MPELGADVNAANSMGLTALLGAANRGSNDIIRVLAANGARLDVVDKEGRSALRWAEGVFLAAVGAERKPATIALLEELGAPNRARAERMRAHRDRRRRLSRLLRRSAAYALPLSSLAERRRPVGAPRPATASAATTRGARGRSRLRSARSPSRIQQTPSLGDGDPQAARRT